MSEDSDGLLHQLLPPKADMLLIGADHAALAFELWRLVQENDMLRARVSEYEADVEQLVATSHSLGHANPKQKIQYHLR